MSKLPKFFNNPKDESKNSVKNLLKFLFADKRDIYVDDINFLPGGGQEAWYCYTYALKQNQPKWFNQKISRQRLLDFIKEEKLNYWECFRYCHTSYWLKQRKIIHLKKRYTNANTWVYSCRVSSVRMRT
jgi:hypothetical protein